MMMRKEIRKGNVKMEEERKLQEKEFKAEKALREQSRRDMLTK
jgi:hypothetical protein